MKVLFKVFFGVIYLWVSCVNGQDGGADSSLSAVKGPSVVYMSGSSTVSSVFLNAHKEEIEKRANVILKVLVKNSQMGLTDLVLGRSDIAMISTGFKYLVDHFNKNAMKAIHVDEYSELKIGETSVVFIVNKKNPIDFLSAEEIRKICRGDILNWKKVGGDDSLIIVFSMQPGDGIRTIVEEELLKGDYFGVYTTVLRNGKVMEDLVGYLPEAFGMNSIKNVDDTVKILKTDVELTQPLILVTQLNPTAEVLAVLKAVKAIIAETSGQVGKKEVKQEG